MLEAHGLPTVTLSALRSRTLKMNPPRTLFTGYPNAAIVGAPDDAKAQLATLRRAFEVASSATEPGKIIDLRDNETIHPTSAG
ncbi:MAG TPA: hypothetical protein VF792_12100 [Ktedonobacterales bacterium]